MGGRFPSDHLPVVTKILLPSHKKTRSGAIPVGIFLLPVPGIPAHVREILLRPPIQLLFSLCWICETGSSIPRTPFRNFVRDSYPGDSLKIGRASCRESMLITGVSVAR